MIEQTLRRVLTAYSWKNPELGYCQAMNIVVAAILILLSHQNLGYMGAPRVLYALAQDGFAAQRAQKVGTGGNPIFAVLVTWLLSVGLILIGGFEFLLLLSVFSEFFSHETINASVSMPKFSIVSRCLLIVL